MEPWVSLTSVGIMVAGFVIAAVLSIVTYRRSREESFRRNLRLMSYSKREIDRAVEEQGW